MSQPEALKSPGHRRRVYTKTEVARMFDMRKDGHADADIGRRFGCHANTVKKLIGRKLVLE